MCQICAQNALAYPNKGTAYAASGLAAAEAPQYGGGGANSWASQGSTSNININGVISGNKWAGSTLTYSFPTLSSQYESGYGNETTNSFSAAPEAVKVAIRTAMNMLSQYTNMVTTEVDPATTTADVRVAFSAEANPTAYAYYPSNNPSGGDIWYGTSYAVYQNPIRGQYAWATTIHELGHALGLKHGHTTGGPGNTALQSQYDQMAYSIMTYRSYEGGPTTGYTNETNGYAQTFMMYDIAALQTMYGANFNTNSGNTTYTWSATTGEMFINGVGQGAPGGNRVFLTIWDGNGIDTYDFSNYSTNLTVNLNPGSFSITSSTQLAYLGNNGTNQYAPGNVFNALQFNGDARSLIENANGGSGNDNITGNAANNTLNGNSGNDSLFGLDGNDTLIGGTGSDALNGGNGIDTASYAGETSGVTISLATGTASGAAAGDTFVSIENLTGTAYADSLTGSTDANVLISGLGADTLNGGDGADTLIGDGVLTWDANAAAIRRLYLAALDRAPDDSGHAGWTGALASGQSLMTISTGFINSTEFQSRYGALNNEQFVTLLYQNVLGRDPDASGLSGWVGALNSGQSREFVLTGFSESTEFQVKTDIREHAGQIYRLYDSCFNRAPDTNGFWGWVDARYGNTKLSDMASMFMNSAEFTNTYGSLDNMSNTQFVNLLYNNVLNRPSDPSGANSWIQALNSGQLSRVDVLLSFSDSNEHLNLMNTGLQTFMRDDTTGRNDTLYGGSGNDTLTGRLGSDTFQFNATDGGTDTIYGFEVFDRLSFSGFSFTNASQALAEMTQQGNNVVFTHNNNSIIFVDTQLSTLQNMTSSGWLFA